MGKSKKNPFEDAILNLVKNGNSKKEAFEEVQARYDEFNSHLNQMSKDIDGHLREVSSSIAGQLITLATFLIGVNGIFISQQDIFQALNDRQKLLVTGVFIALFASIAFGATDYIRARIFYGKWREGYIAVRGAISDGLANGKIQWINDLNRIEKETLDERKLPNSTGEKFSTVQLTLVVAGGLFFVLVLLGFVYDLPVIK